LLDDRFLHDDRDLDPGAAQEVQHSPVPALV